MNDARLGVEEKRGRKMEGGDRGSIRKGEGGGRGNEKEEGQTGRRRKGRGWRR